MNWYISKNIFKYPLTIHEYIKKGINEYSISSIYEGPYARHKTLCCSSHCEIVCLVFHFITINCNKELIN